MCGPMKNEYTRGKECTADDMQRKSRKRKAAELKAARRASSSQLNENTRGEWIGHVNSSDNDGSSSSFTTTVCSVERDWTRQCMHVDVPARVDWSAIFSDSRYFSSTARELDVMVVEHDVAKGLEWLNQGARDSVVAIDLEWRPDSKYTSNHVACIQLATTTRCLVVRCCRWRAKRQLPQVLVDFFRNPDNLFVSFSCDRGDDRKMNSTFGIGKQLFGNFIDIQKIATRFGYPDTCGLSVLSRFVLGVSLPKSKFVSRSDWQRHTLSVAQVRYAALDAFVTGEIFRTFRVWENTPQQCLACKRDQGSVVWHTSQEVRIEHATAFFVF